MNKLLDYLIDGLLWLVKVGIVVVVIGTLAYYGAEAFVKEDNARIRGLEQKWYDMALARTPHYPTSARPEPTDLVKPKTRVFQDAGRGK